MFSLVVLIILIASALNWFAIGVFQFDIIAGLFGSQSVFVSRFIYTLFGLAGLWTLLLLAIKKGHLDFRKQKSDSSPTSTNNEKTIIKEDKNNFNNSQDIQDKQNDDTELLENIYEDSSNNNENPDIIKNMNNNDNINNENNNDNTNSKKCFT